MKNLFKILALGVIAVLLFMSCNEDIQRVSDPMDETTIAIQQAAKDTVLMTFVSEEKVVILNKDTNLVEYELYGVDHNNTIFFGGVIVGVAFALIILAFIGVFD